MKGGKLIYSHTAGYTSFQTLIRLEAIEVTGSSEEISTLITEYWAGRKGDIVGD